MNVIRGAAIPRSTLPAMAFQSGASWRMILRDQLLRYNDTSKEGEGVQHAWGVECYKCGSNNTVVEKLSKYRPGDIHCISCGAILAHEYIPDTVKDIPDPTDMPTRIRIRYTLVCEECHAEFESKTKTRKTCSISCWKKHARKINEELRNHNLHSFTTKVCKKPGCDNTFDSPVINGYRYCEEHRWKPYQKKKKRYPGPPHTGPGVRLR